MNDNLFDLRKNPNKTSSDGKTNKPGDLFGLSAIDPSYDPTKDINLQEYNGDFQEEDPDEPQDGFPDNKIFHVF
ncbi:MAG: hypothetical protein U5L76_04155 [Patescibacteria group bacterium]|nr:hypothetical protein [Patescibacteria group bacterium]